MGYEQGYAEAKEKYLTPVSAHNDQLFAAPSYECICPLQVDPILSRSISYYIYLEFLDESPSSLRIPQENKPIRFESRSATEDDISFFVGARNP